MSMENLKNKMIELFQENNIEIKENFEADEIVNYEDGEVILRFDEFKKIHNDLNDYEINFVILGMTLKDEDLLNEKINALFAKVQRFSDNLTAESLRTKTGEAVIGLVHENSMFKFDADVNVFEISKKLYVCNFEF